MKFLETNTLRKWLASSPSLSAYTHSIGRKRPDPEYVRNVLGLPYHLMFVIDELTGEHLGDLPPGALDSIPFYSLCRGLLLPLSGMAPEKVAQLFGFRADDPPGAARKEALLEEFLAKDIGLGLTTKLGCILGDPFLGQRAGLKRDSLITLLLSVRLASRRFLLNRLTVVGDVAVLFAETRPSLRQDPPLTAAEVLETLRFLPEVKRTRKFELLRSLLARCGKLEAYFLAKLVLRKAGFGFEYQGPLIARTLADHFGAAEEQVTHAIALTDSFHVARVLSEEGPEGLKAVQLQPLVPVRPALAGGSTDQLKDGDFPVWVERKYDGIRLMIHKSTDTRGSTLCGAYTRSRADWLEMIAGLDPTIRAIPAMSAIIDGELYGTVFSGERVKPASVYEVYASLQGERERPVSLKFAAFDLIYLNGRDLTRVPLSERRQRLRALIAPLQSYPLPVPLTLAEGQLANDPHDLNRLYGHFRAQGYEGIITKDLASPYLLASRDSSWRKRKPLITLDLVILAAVYAVTEKKSAGLFGSYVIGARTPDGTYEEVGDVAGLDRQRDGEIQAEIMREGLITGRRIERTGVSGTRPGLELRPHLVVTVKFEGIVKDNITGALSLRDPKVVMIRSDKSPLEADTTTAIEQLFLKQRVG